MSIFTTHRARPDQDADRRLAQRLLADLTELDRAKQALATVLASARGEECCAEGRCQSPVRHHCQDVVRAYDAAVRSAGAALRVATGPLEGLPRTRVIATRYRPEVRNAERLLQDLRLGRQRHLLAGGPRCGGAHPDGGQAFAAGAVGAVWPLSDYQPETEIYRTKTLLPPVEV